MPSRPPTTMLYSLDLERSARRVPGTPSADQRRRDLTELIERGRDHPEHLAELLLDAAREEPLRASLEERAWLLGRIESLAEARGCPGSMDGLLMEVYQDYLLDALRRQRPEELAGIAAGFRTLRRRDRYRHRLASHLQWAWEQTLEAARAADEYLFAALITYQARWLADGGAPLREPLAAFLGLYRLASAFRDPARAELWFHPTLRALERALASDASRRLVEAEPELLTGYLEGLWVDLARLAGKGRERALGGLLWHLGFLARSFPGIPALRAAFLHLPRVLDAAPGGRHGRLARVARAALPPLGELPRPAPCWPRLDETLGGLSRQRCLKDRVSTSLRPRSRQHLALFLEALHRRRHLVGMAGALYPPNRHLPYPLVALYYPRGQGEELAHAARGPLDVHLEKLEGAYRLNVVDTNTRRILTGHSLIDELDTHPFRHALERSGGTYAVALVELETLEVSALRFQSAYLDFTGAYHRGIERLSRGDLEAAIRELEKALAANPRLCGVNCHLGHCYRKLSRNRLDLERSVNCFQRELTSHPESCDALNNLGVLSLVEGRLDEALDYLERAVAAEPSHLTALTNLVALRLSTPDRPGVRDRIQELLKRIYALDGESPAVRALVDEASEALDQDLMGYLRTEPL